MQPLPFEDQRYLEAAQGWFELGLHLEANEELENITPENRAHPAVLEVRWQIYATAKKWEGALDIASALAQLVPESTLGWIYRSHILHELKRPAPGRARSGCGHLGHAIGPPPGRRRLRVAQRRQPHPGAGAHG